MLAHVWAKTLKPLWIVNIYESMIYRMPFIILNTNRLNYTRSYEYVTWTWSIWTSSNVFECWCPMYILLIVFFVFVCFNILTYQHNNFHRAIGKKGSFPDFIATALECFWIAWSTLLPISALTCTELGRLFFYIHLWKLTRLAGKSPCSIRDMIYLLQNCSFSIVMLVLRCVWKQVLVKKTN